MFEMTFDVYLIPDGNVHVQNSVGPFLGQHHVHTREGFRRWKRDVKARTERPTKRDSCPCGLSPGQVRDREGNVKHALGNERWK